MDAADLAQLAQDEWFGAIPPAEQAALLREARVVEVHAGERLYTAGDPPNGLWAVLAGQVRLKGYSANGVELLALILRPATWFGELSMLDGGPRPHDAIAFGDSRLLKVPIAGFVRAAEAQSQLYRHLGLLVCRHQRSALAFITQNVAQPVRARLANTLARASDGEAGRVRLRQDELAALVGVSRQSLNRHLRTFEAAGWVALGYAELRVLDRGALRAIAAA